MRPDRPRRAVAVALNVDGDTSPGKPAQPSVVTGPINRSLKMSSKLIGGDGRRHPWPTATNGCWRKHQRKKTGRALLLIYASELAVTPAEVMAVPEGVLSASEEFTVLLEDEVLAT